MKPAIWSVLLWVALHGTARGQNVTVQQPILGTTSVSTSVVVPDRGRAFLGGSAAAQSGRTRGGFLPSGSSVGLSRSSNSLSVGVTIIDLREMDEAILSSVPERSEPNSRFARHAAAIRHSSPTPENSPTRDAESSAERAANFERLARKAEAENRPGVAKLHWQMAAKYGSATARERLVTRSR
jgi:hypothetical protein